MDEVVGTISRESRNLSFDSPSISSSVGVCVKRPSIIVYATSISAISVGFTSNGLFSSTTISASFADFKTANLVVHCKLPSGVDRDGANRLFECHWRATFGEWF